jgi:hypothetical protein
MRYSPTEPSLAAPITSSSGRTVQYHGELQQGDCIFMQEIFSYTRRRRKRIRISGSVAVAENLRFRSETLGALSVVTHVVRNVFSLKCDLSEYYFDVGRVPMSIRGGLFQKFMLPTRVLRGEDSHMFKQSKEVTRVWRASHSSQPASAGQQVGRVSVASPLQRVQHDFITFRCR